MTKFVKCDYCGKKIPKSDASWVEGKLYCEDCVSEAEIYADADVFDEDDDEDDDDND